MIWYRGKNIQYQCVDDEVFRPSRISTFEKNLAYDVAAQVDQG